MSKKEKELLQNESELRDEIYTEIDSMYNKIENK